MSIYNLFNNAASGVPQVVINFGDEPSDDMSLEVNVSGTVTSLSLTLSGSDDGVTYAALGSAVTSTGVTKVTTTSSGPVAYVKAVLGTFTGGGHVTAFLAVVDDD